MSDDKPQYAHATSENGPWRPVDVDSPEAAAREAVHAWAHEDPAVVLVGLADWWGPDDIASLADAESLIEDLDIRIYENIWEEAPSLRNRASEADIEALDQWLKILVADFVESVDYTDLFRVPTWTEWRVVKWPEEDGGPEVRPLAGGGADE